MIKFYIIFSLFYYAHQFFYDWNRLYGAKGLIPLYIVLSRDYLWCGIIIYYCIKYILFLFVSSKKTSLIENIKLPKFAIEFVIYISILIVISLPHLLHINIIELFQNIFRNLYIYSPLPILLILFIKKRELEKIYFLIFYLSIIVYIFGIFTIIFNTFLWGDGRMISTIGNPNNLGIFALWIFLLTYSGFYFKKENKLFFGIVSIFSIIIIFFSGSLSNFICLGVAFIFIHLLFYKYKNFFKGAILICIIVLGILAIDKLFKINKFNNFYYRIESRIFRLSKKNLDDKEITSVSGRIRQFKICIKELKQKFTWYEVLLGSMKNRHYVKFDVLYLMLIMNSGLISFLLILILFFRMIIMHFLLLKKCKILKDYENLYIIYGNFLFLIINVILNFWMNTYLNRFPINFIFYFIIGTLFVLRFDCKIKNKNYIV